MENYYETKGYLLIKAAMNRRYAEANRDTFARTGGKLGSLYMADVHDACAKTAQRKADTIKQLLGE